MWTDEENVALENTVRYGGGTVAVMQTYMPDVLIDSHIDSDIANVYIGIVCRELACTAQRGRGGEAQVTPDGRTAYLGQDAKGVYLWTSLEGIHLAPWSGHPGFDYHVVSPSTPVLAPDGSLRVTRRPPGACLLARPGRRCVGHHA